MKMRRYLPGCTFLVFAAVCTAAAAGDSITLFNGKTLRGWHLSDTADNSSGWFVQKGELVCHGRTNTANLVTDRSFRDFSLHLEFLLTPGANSGVYLRGLYEVQIFDDHSRPKCNPTSRCGAIFDHLAPNRDAYLGPGQWNSLDVELTKKRVQVRLNGQPIVQGALPNEPGKRALHIKQGAPGPIMLQSWSGGVVRFKNIYLRTLD